MILADTLSILPNPNDKDAIELNLRVDSVEMTAAEIQRCDLDLTNFSTEQTAPTSTMNALSHPYTLLQAMSSRRKSRKR